MEFEYKRKTGIAQCKNCQLFGHSSRNCKHKFRCVKCTEDHAPKQCPRTLDPQLAINTPASCVNCKGDHPANFRSCPAFLKVIERKQNQHQPSRNQPAPQNPPQAPRQSLRTEGMSFAAALSSQTPTIPSPQSSSNSNYFDFFDNECKKYFNVDLAVLHSKFKAFHPQYIALPDDKRSMALLGFTMSLSA